MPNIPDLTQEERAIRANVAVNIVEKVFKFRNIPPATNVSQYLDSVKERTYMAHMFNGPIADWIESRQSTWRWISCAPADLNNIQTAGELMAVCEKHLITDAQASAL